MKNQITTALKYLLVMTVLTGILYPLLMTGISQIVFPSKANGSLIKTDSRITGSELIGQKFDSSIYFWSRPSSSGYNAVPSAASNYGPTSDTLKKLVAERRILFAQMNPGTGINNIPEEMLFASASGLDPHISPKSALIQVDRIAKARHFDEMQRGDLVKLIHKMTESPQYLIFGERRINVLKLNIELDRMKFNTQIRR